ncbi:MAG: RNA polymerase sigma factor, partial [Nitrospinota bacterium]
VEDAVKVQDIYRAIDKLPVKLKEAMLLVVDEGLSHKEAAKVLCCAETTISWRVFLARKKLKKRIANG